MSWTIVNLIRQHVYRPQGIAVFEQQDLSDPPQDASGLWPFFQYLSGTAAAAIRLSTDASPNIFFFYIEI